MPPRLPAQPLHAVSKQHMPESRAHPPADVAGQESQPNAGDVMILPGVFGASPGSFPGRVSDVSLIELRWRRR